MHSASEGGINFSNFNVPSGASRNICHWSNLLPLRDKKAIPANSKPFVAVLSLRFPFRCLSGVLSLGLLPFANMHIVYGYVLGIVEISILLPASWLCECVRYAAGTILLAAKFIVTYTHDTLIKIITTHTNGENINLTTYRRHERKRSESETLSKHANGSYFL